MVTRWVTQEGYSSHDQEEKGNAEGNAVSRLADARRGEVRLATKDAVGESKKKCVLQVAG